MEETKKTSKEKILEFFKKQYKKLIAGLLAVIIIAVSCLLLFQHSAAPKIDDIYDRMVFLLESSQDVNALIFGYGLPVWEDDSEYVEFEHIYHNLSSARNYEIVMPNAKYHSIDQIKEHLQPTVYRCGFERFHF